MKINVAKIYESLFTTDKSYAMIKGGRVTGKTYATSQLVAIDFLNKEGDIIVFRAFSKDNITSIFNEILQILMDWGFGEIIETKTKQVKIINKDNGNTIYFTGIGGPDQSRTKGFKSNKPISLIVGEELQQVSKQESYEQAMATFTRGLKEDGKVILIFNPERRASHWVNVFFRHKEFDPNWLTLSTTYKDVATYLNDHTLAMIETERRTNPTNYKYLYLGETEGLWGAVYANYDPERHRVTEAIVRYMIRKYGIHCVLIGADPALTKDKTALVPIAVLNNGQAFVLNYFYHDPETNGVIPNDQLVQYIDTWINDLKQRWWSEAPQKKVEIIFDSASQDLMYTYNYRTEHDFVEVQAYKQKNIIEMVQIMQKAFSRNMLYILDDGGVFNYYTENFEYGNDPLNRQLLEVIWNDNGDKFDRSVDNDATDALTYGIAHYFKNLDALYYPRMESFYTPIQKDLIEKQEGENRAYD